MTRMIFLLNKHVLDSIHTDVVRSAVSNYQDNRVLGAPAPEVDTSETFLPRQTRVVLAQLRSSFCSRLKSYQHRLGKADDDICPDCGAAPHTSSHLFQCPSFPTNLDPVALWRTPWEAASHLVRIPAFSDLPAVGPPPPLRRHRRRPPPEPPPNPPPA